MQVNNENLLDGGKKSKHTKKNRNRRESEANYICVA